MVKILRFSPEYVAEQIGQWELHRKLVRQVPLAISCRHLAGLAMILLREEPVESEDGMAFAFDRDVAWLSLVDVPIGQWRLRRSRPVDWVALLRTRLIKGLPALGPAPLRQWDFVAHPVTAGKRPHNHAFDPAMSPRYFGVLNALELAMTSARSWLSGSWRKSLVRNFAAEFQLDKGIRLGDTLVDHLPRPRQWMPRPFLAFPLELADRLGRMVQHDGKLPEGTCVSLAPEKGLVHVPAELVAPIAERLSVESELAWCLEPAASYMCRKLGAFILPPLALKTWDDWQGILPGQVAVNFTPRHREFIPRREAVGIQRHVAA